MLISHTNQEDDEDRQSNTSSSQDRGSLRSGGFNVADPTPRVGADTTCVVCLGSCGPERRPKLLTCLHSCCGGCFADRLAAAKRENSDSDVVDLEDDVQVGGILCNNERKKLTGLPVPVLNLFLKIMVS
jgi:hypothetical protein